MELVIPSKNSRSGKFAGVITLWGLAAVALGMSLRFGFQIFPAAIFSTVLILISFALLRAAFRPRKDQWLTIDDAAVRWRVCRGTEPAVAHRIPLNSIQSVKIVTAPGSGDAGSETDFFFVLRDGSEKPVPREFSPGFHRRQIGDALRERLPNLKIHELDATENA